MSFTDLYLAPVPKVMRHRDGVFDLSGKRYIQLNAQDPQSIIGSAKQTGLALELTASPKAPADKLGMIISLDESSSIPPEGYHLDIGTEFIEITASTQAGAFYGACTLLQILRQTGETIPCLSIEDCPDHPDRGVMLDISRDKVPTMETLYHLVDLLSEWKINQLHLYTEHVFAYLAHPTVWENASPLTGEEILALDAYCRSKYIDLVPNQNSFAHMTRWLVHDEYRPMAESPNGGETMWGYRNSPFGLCPVDERSIDFIAGLYEELLPHFSSKLFYAGCDEAADLGYGRSKQLCEEVGTGRVYMDFLMQIYKLVKQHGRTMIVADDMIMKYPELLDELPRDVILLEWGYESYHPFGEHGAKFREAGIPYYVVPGTSAWCSLSGRTENAIDNIASAAASALANGAKGIINATFGDHGHWDPLSVAYLGFMVGAMASWNGSSDIRTTLPMNLSINAFHDMTGKTGRAFYDLGNLYRLFAGSAFNSSIYWHMLFNSSDPAELDTLCDQEFAAMENSLDEIESALHGERMEAADADTIRAEIQFVINICRLAARIGRIGKGGYSADDIEERVRDIKDQHRHVWLLRNRQGGLEDSVAKLDLDWLMKERVKESANGQ